MAIRQRAVLAEDKQERHRAILDAAERLLMRSPERVANVAEVADEAGLAKGTVYLYFPSKEELLLAVHERNSANFFAALQARLDQPQPVSIDDLLEITRAHMIEVPTFLPLATRCLGLMGTEIPQASAQGYLERMNQRLAQAGAGLERHFDALRPGEGVSLLHHSYALILGLWQLSSAKNGPASPIHCPVPQLDYPAELAHALRALWRGRIEALAESRQGG
jgi:AcrR family transcriptional regulator